MADVRMQMVVAVVRNENKNGGDVKKDIHGYEQKYLFYGKHEILVFLGSSPPMRKYTP